MNLKTTLQSLDPTASAPRPPTLRRRFDPLALAILILSPVAAIGLALLCIAVPLVLTGKDPLFVYGQMYGAAWGDSYGQSETIVKAIPLILLGLGVAVAFRARLWNIGAEGQFYAGVLGATALALAFPSWPAWTILPAMFVAGGLCGALWAFVPALLRGWLGVNEIITSLMLNYVAINLTNYFIYGPWKDPKAYNFPKTATFSDASALPTLVENTRIHAGLIIAIVAIVVVWLVLSRTSWGFELKVLGESSATARYAGMPVVRNIILAFVVSGALAGLAGMSEVAGIAHRLEPNLSPGYGYTAIIVAWLARLNPWGVGLVAILFGGLLSSGFTMQRLGVSSGLVTLLQGAILFFVLAGEALSRRLLYTRALQYQSERGGPGRRRIEVDLINLLAITITAGTPVLFATLGELLTERSGVLNLGLEGMMLVGALAAFAATVTTGNLWAGVLASLIAGALLALVHAFFTITIGVNQVVSGLALVLVGQGLASYLGRPFIGQVVPDSFKPVAIPLLSSIPVVGRVVFQQDWLVYGSFLLVPIMVFYIYRTRPGLNLRAVGDSPATADAAGLPVIGLRYLYVCVGGALCGLGGAYMSLAYIPSWNENVTAGRGWIAVGLVIFAMWNPWRALLGAYLFGFVDGLNFQLQVSKEPITFLFLHLNEINTFFLKMLPYLVVIAALVFSQWRMQNSRRASRSQPPAALGLLYLRRDKN